ncbi:MAG: hypothetical protein AAF597_06460 [Bacteroidota bacterium]
MATETKTRTGWGDYLIQVSLIILSILVALGVDRCSQNSRNNKRLDAYLKMMEQEFEDEMYFTSNNIDDAQKDIDNLQFGMQAFPQGIDSLTTKALMRGIATFNRGVFRGFPPMTYERMEAVNDAFLIKDLSLREQLSSTAAFRTDYVQADLANYDAMILEAIDRFSRYVDVGCLIRNIRSGTGVPLDCVTDADALRRYGAADFSKLLYLAQIRKFHLERYQQSIENSKEALGGSLGGR